MLSEFSSAPTAPSSMQQPALPSVISTFHDQPINSLAQNNLCSSQSIINYQATNLCANLHRNQQPTSSIGRRIITWRRAQYINCTTSQHNALIGWQKILVTMLPPSNDYVHVTLYKLLVHIS